MVRLRSVQQGWYPIWTGPRRVRGGGKRQNMGHCGEMWLNRLCPLTYKQNLELIKGIIIKITYYLPNSLKIWIARYFFLCIIFHPGTKYMSQIRWILPIRRTDKANDGAANISINWTIINSITKSHIFQKNI